MLIFNVKSEFKIFSNKVDRNTMRKYLEFCNKTPVAISNINHLRPCVLI